MPVPMPRLIRDAKSGIYFFRLVLPRSVAGKLQKCVYFSLKTRENKVARSKAAVLNLRIEMTKPFIDLENIRELIKIDLKNGIFHADTPDEQERGLKIIQAMGNANGKKSSEDVEPGQLFSEIKKTYLGEITPTLKSTTVYKYKKSFEFFLAHLSDKNVNSYTKDDINIFKEKMLALEKVPHTINGYLGCLSGFFQYAIKNKKRTNAENPVEGTHIKNSKRQLKKRDQFHDDDLQAIFKWDSYKDFAIKPDYFWAPVICLYSGLRPEEITSLEVKEIRKSDGIYFFDVKDAKTPAGVRPVPIHSHLIEMGLFDYISKVKEKGKLFWYLKDGSNGTKKNLSRQFSKYLNTVGIKEDDNCFYSLRHSVVTRLVARNVSNSTIYMLSGHKSGTSAHFNYLHDLPIQSLKDAIETLDWHKQINFSEFDFLKSFTVFD
jgi:integrase